MTGKTFGDILAERERQARQPAATKSATADSAITRQHGAPYQPAIAESATTESAAANSVTAVDGYLQLPNTVVDSLMAILPGPEFKLYVRLFRLSRGFHRDTCTAGHARLAESCGISATTLRGALRRLRGLGLVEVVKPGVNQSAASIYRVVVPGEAKSVVAKSATAKSATAKSASMKENKKTHETPALAAPGDVVFQIRAKALRLREVLLARGELTRDRLLDQVGAVCLADGIEASAETVDEAIRGMA